MHESTVIIVRAFKVSGIIKHKEEEEWNNKS